MIRNRWTKALLLIAAIGLLSQGTSGCSPEWKRKFIRKKKDVKEVQPILVLHSGSEALFPPAARYQERYAYWKSWHIDLLTSLGQIKKRDLRNLSGVIGELRSMQALLDGPPSQRLQQILVELQDLEQSWDRMPSATWHTSSVARSRLEQLQREISKELYYSRVKDHIVQDAPEPKKAG